MATHLVIGLGNPGDRYQATRHNTGFRIVDAFAHAFRMSFSMKKKFHSEIADSPAATLAKPQTFMNDSGKAVQAVASYYKIQPKNIIVIHDDLDIPFGEIKIQFGRGPAGHKGVASIIQSLKTNAFWRIRVGIAGKTKDEMPGDAYVISEFTKTEEEALKKNIIPNAYIALAEILHHGPEKAAQKFNTKKGGPKNRTAE
jgi:PTH1 family peptidyl-tRNA hydrolase